ncbi:MAG TPA: NRDE family protein [Oleiagrimonas sp.]|nr:NRDE family protein [Oleiagrimonas sp.]
MCLIAFAWKAHPRWRLLLLGNRDEAHARPAAPLAHWDEAPDVMAGRDLEAGGTWMGVSADGRAGVVTNVRDPGASKAGASRGFLVADYLRGTASADACAHALHVGSVDFRPFNLLLFDAGQAFYLGNHPHRRLQPVTPGVHGLSNADFNTPWPKTRALEERLQAWLQHDVSDDFEPLFTALADDARWPDDVLPDTGVGVALERELSAAFIRGERYGTRASTVIAVDHQGGGCIIERSFGPAGEPYGQRRLDFT